QSSRRRAHSNAACTKPSCATTTQPTGRCCARHWCDSAARTSLVAVRISWCRGSTTLGSLTPPLRLARGEAASPRSTRAYRASSARRASGPPSRSAATGLERARSEGRFQGSLFGGLWQSPRRLTVFLRKLLAWSWVAVPLVALLELA